MKFADWNQKIKLEPNNAQNILNRVGWHLKNGYIEIAIEDYTRAIVFSDDNPVIASEAYTNRGYCYFELNKLQQAWIDFSQAIERNAYATLAFYYRHWIGNF